MKKKLLIVVSGAKFFISHRLSLAKAAKAADYDVHVATPPSELSGQITKAGLTYHPIRLDRGGFNPFKDIFTLFSLWRLYRRLKPDIVHHVTVKPILYGGIIARLVRVPAVVNALTGLGFMFIAQSRTIKILSRIILGGYKTAFRHKNMRVIFQNDDDRKYFIQTNILKPDKSILILGSGVCMNTFYPTSELQGIPHVMLVSRLLWDKGVGEFVDAARILKKKGVSARFILVGGVDHANPASISETQLKRWEEESVIEWWGEHTEMPSIIQKAHIICLPSYREGLPRILVEAAASARAIVATDTPGCRDVVRNGENGLLVPVKNSEKLAAAIEMLIRNPSLRKKMAHCGRKLVENEFNLDQVIRQTLAVYEILLEKKGVTLTPNSLMCKDK